MGKRFWFYGQNPITRAKAKRVLLNLYKTFSVPSSREASEGHRPTATSFKEKGLVIPCTSPSNHLVSPAFKKPTGQGYALIQDLWTRNKIIVSHFAELPNHMPPTLPRNRLMLGFLYCPFYKVGQHTSKNQQFTQKVTSAGIHWVPHYFSRIITPDLKDTWTVFVGIPLIQHAHQLPPPSH